MLLFPLKHQTLSPSSAFAAPFFFLPPYVGKALPPLLPIRAGSFFFPDSAPPPFLRVFFPPLSPVGKDRTPLSSLPTLVEVLFLPEKISPEYCCPLR